MLNVTNFKNLAVDYLLSSDNSAKVWLYNKD